MAIENPKTLNVRIRNKYDSYENWAKSSLVLEAGEIAIAYTTVNVEVGNGKIEQHPELLMKVGDGTKTFADPQLPWLSAKAADVAAWAKAANKPTYEAKEITGIDSYIADYVNEQMGISVDTDTQYQIVKVDDYNYKLQSKGKTDEAWADVANSVIVIPNDTAAIEALEELVGDTKVATQISTAISELDLANTYEAKGEAAKVQTALDTYKTSNDTAVKANTDAIAANTSAISDIKDGAVLDSFADVETALDGKEVSGAAAQALIDAQAYATTKAGQALTDAKAYVDAEDVFEIDMLTVNAHGGVAAGTDLNGMTTHEILKKILYPYVEPTLGNATASPNGGTYEKGVTKTITSVSISVTKKSEAITSVALYNGSTLIEEKTGDTVKNGGTITFSNVNVEVPTNGNQLTVKVTDAANKTYEKKTSSMTFVYPYYMGSCAAGTAIDETLVESLTKKVESKGNKSNSFTVSDGHMVFAYPKAHGVLKSILDPNNFETIGNYTRSEVSITGLDGTAQTYYVYVSGATTVSGFTVNFKY